MSNDFAIEQLYLLVHSKAKLTQFYTNYLGMNITGNAENWVGLGSSNHTLVTLIEDKNGQRPDKHATGLYHVAITLPTPEDLLSWYLMAKEHNLPLLGAADHGVSLGIYLKDPEGNGFEIGADRPTSSWEWEEGKLLMPLNKLDIENLLKTSDTTCRPWRGLPDGTKIGHVHMKGANLAAASTFYAKLLGLDITHEMEGAIFYAQTGYHHHIAVNQWESLNGPLREEHTLGLLGIEFSVCNDNFEAIKTRAIEFELPFETGEQSLTFLDPSNLKVMVVTR